MLINKMSRVYKCIMLCSFLAQSLFLGLTQNCIPLSEIIIPYRECVIQLGIGEVANVLLKQVSHMIR
jgi:hypothetical protein